MEQCLVAQGRPVKLYWDRHTIFFSSKEEKLTMQDQFNGRQTPLTQFGRARQELKIQMVKARSPQAKERIERLWNTLQSPLPVMFELYGITSLEQSNTFLTTALVYFNDKFAVAAEHPVPAFRPLAQNSDLKTILCAKHTRTLIDEGAFSTGGSTTS